MNELWLDSTYQLVDEITGMDAYKRLIELQQVMKTDPTIKTLVEAFKTSSERYDDVKKYGKYHPDLKQVQAKFANDKRALYTHPVVVEYKTLEKEIQSILDEISKELATAVSTKIKHPNDIGLIPKH